MRFAPVGVCGREVGRGGWVGEVGGAWEVLAYSRVREWEEEGARVRVEFGAADMGRESRVVRRV